MTKGADTPEPMFCVGPSMYPTVRAGDLLLLAPPDQFAPARGDVIVFRVPVTGECITHRIVRVVPGGFKTRGDNNSSIDPWVVEGSWIVGKVTAVERQAKRLVIEGGAGGYALFRLLRLRKALLRPLSRALSPGYQFLARAGHVSRIIPLQERMRVISLRRPQGNELRLLLGTVVVGRLPPGATRWLIRRPFRLWVDESSLPKG
jgi:signal peptidase